MGTKKKSLLIKGRPIPVNSLYRGRRFLTENGKAIKTIYAYSVKSQWKEKMEEGPVAVMIIYHYTNKVMADIDGPLKALLDSLTGIVIKDDKQIESLFVGRQVDTGLKEAYTEITILPMRDLNN